MIAYLDSSVLLRKLLGEPDPLAEFSQVSYFVSSELLRVECFRTLHRLRITAQIGDSELAERAGVLHRAMGSIELVRITPEVLEFAAGPFPTALGTLDAIHAATALLWVRHEKRSLRMLTHDAGLGLAARALGLEVLGV